MDDCKYSYKAYCENQSGGSKNELLNIVNQLKENNSVTLGGTKSEHENIMSRLDKLEEQEEASKQEMSPSEKKRIREMNEISEKFKKIKDDSEQRKLEIERANRKSRGAFLKKDPNRKKKTLTWNSKLNPEHEQFIQNEEKSRKALLNTIFRRQRTNDGRGLLESIKTEVYYVPKDETRGKCKEYSNELERDKPGSSSRKMRNHAWINSVFKYAINKKQRIENPDPEKEEFLKNLIQSDKIIKELKEMEPERIGGGNLIGRMERLSKRKPKKKLRWASDIENVQEIDARSEGFDETRGKSYIHSYELEKEKPGSSLGNKDWFFKEGLKYYRENPYKNEKFEEYEKNLKETDEIIKELASKKSGGAVQSPIETPVRVRNSMSSSIIKSNEYGFDVMLGEDLESPDKDTSIDSSVESNCIKEINKVLSEKDMEKQQKIMAINRLDKDICPRQLKMNGLQAAHLGKLELPSNKDDSPKQSSEKKVFDFVNETFSEGQIPVIIKLSNEKTYFFTQEDILKQLNNGLVFPCYQANNLATTQEPPPDLPNGVKPGQQNWDDSEKLFSFQTLLNRRVLVSFDDFKDLVLNSKTTPITIVGTESERKIPAIMKYQWVVVKHPITGDIIRTGWEFVGGVGMLHCNKISWANEKETFWNIENAQISFTKEEEKTLKEKFGHIYNKSPPKLSPPPPLSPPPSSSNNTVMTYSTVHTMSDWNSPAPPPYSDSSMEPRYSDETIRGRPSPLDIDETRRRLSFGDSDSEEDRSLNSAMNAVLTNAAHLRQMQQEHNSPDSMFDNESHGDFRSPVSVEEMRNNARSPAYDRTRARSPSPFDTPENRAIRQRTSRLPTTPPGSAPVGRPSRRFLRQEAMGEEPPPVPRLNRVTQEPDRRTTRLWSPLTPPPPLRARPRNRNNSNNNEDTEEVFARLPSSDTSLSAQSDDSGMV